MFEIKVAKIKATKTIINQFQYPSLEVLQRGTVIGFVCNIIKDEYQTLLIECDGQYFRTEKRDWEIWGERPHEVISGRLFKNFKNAVDASEWLTAYNRCKNAENAAVQLFV